MRPASLRPSAARPFGVRPSVPPIAARIVHIAAARRRRPEWRARRPLTAAIVAACLLALPASALGAGAKEIKQATSAGLGYLKAQQQTNGSLPGDPGN